MRTARRPSRRGAVGVVVPVYGGREATRSCLAALARQKCKAGMDVTVVDDACPDGDLAAEVAAAAAREGWRHIRNASNVGFAAAVNRGAALAEGEHVLLLNADAILLPGAVDRLLAAAAVPGVGTAVPLSNDGAFASFPTMRRAHPAPDEAEASRIDDAAREAAAALAPAWRAVDIPAGTAFCMLVTGPCWDALGGLDLGYGRGYFEDVDLCLRAKRAGFRNVLASDVYVRHLGGQSFGAAKRALVADNARLLLERFPDYEAEWTAFAGGDPLRAVREGIERRSPPREPVHIVAGRRATTPDLAGADFAGADFAGADFARAGDGDAARPTRTLLLQEGRDGELRLRAADGGPPQNLRFARHERADRASYLRGLQMAGLSLADPSDGLLAELDAVVPQTARVSIAITGPRSLRLLERGSGLLGRARVEVRDGMGRAALGRPASPLPPPQPPRGGPPRLAALVPWPTVEVDRLVLAIDRRLRARGGEVVILGEALGQRGRPAASGAMGRADYPEAIHRRAVTHLLLPDADAPFLIIEELRGPCPLPAAYVAWAPGRHRAAPGDLALPPDGTDAERASAVAAWCFAASCFAGVTGDGARA